MPSNPDAVQLAFYREGGNTNSTIKGSISVINNSWDPKTITWHYILSKQNTAVPTYTIPPNIDIWAYFDVTSEIKSMLSGSLANNGFLIEMDENGVTSADFTSSEGLIAENHPKLIFHYGTTGALPDPAKHRTAPVFIARQSNRIVIDNYRLTNATLRLFTIQGKIVYEAKNIGYGTTVPVHFPGGAYLITVENPSLSYCGKKIIQK